jgi:hypothetical protein
VKPCGKRAGLVRGGCRVYGGNDVIIQGRGSIQNHLNGGSGDDVLVGGDGSSQGGDPHDVIVDLKSGETATDVDQNVL